MGDFGDAERRILSLMHVGAKFIYQGEEYIIVRSGKPTCYRGEPKTDVYAWEDLIRRNTYQLVQAQLGV